MRCRSEASVVCCRLCGFTRVCALWPQTYAHCSHVLVSVYYIELCIGFASTAVYYSASMCSLDGGGVLDAVQPQRSRRCQFWMAYHQVGSDCSHTQRPEQETEWQLCDVNCCCGVGCCMLPVQLNGCSMKLGGSTSPPVRLTPQDHDHEFMHVVIELLHA